MDFQQFANKLVQNKSFAIICHARPDGDAIGSSIGLQKGLQSLGKVADVFCVDDIPVKFSAILNIEGTDYLVKKGDMVNNYKILNNF